MINNVDPEAADDTAGGLLSVDPEILRANAAAVGDFYGRPISAVVKGDGYGLGAAACAEAFWRAGIRVFLVGDAGEGALVKQRLPRARVCVLHSGAAPLAQAWRFPGLDWVLGRQALSALPRAIRRSGPPPPLIVEVDCGTGRAGVPLNELHDVLRALRGHVAVKALSAHFPRTVPEETLRPTLDVLESVSASHEITEVSLGGGDVLPWSAQAPPQWPVRVGRLLYGVEPRWALPENVRIRTPFRWTARGRVLHPPGVVGYGADSPPPGAPLQIEAGFAHGMPTRAEGRWQLLCGTEPYLVTNVFMLTTLAFPLAGRLPVGHSADVLILGGDGERDVSVRATAAALAVPTSSVMVAVRPGQRGYLPPMETSRPSHPGVTETGNVC